MSKLINIPRKKRQAYADGVRVFLADEAPKIGTGWRTVSIEHEGRKWVKIREVSTDRPARLNVDTWRRVSRGTS